MSNRAAKHDYTLGTYRRIYSGFMTGKRINRLSIGAEAWFWRVLSIADDYGNFRGEPTLVFAATVGRREDVSRENVGQWLKEHVTVGLLSEYSVDGEAYLHVDGWVKRQPGGKNGKRVHRVPASPWDREADGPAGDPHGADPATDERLSAASAPEVGDGGDGESGDPAHSGDHSGGEINAQGDGLGESGGIRVNPDLTGCARPHHNHNHNHNHKQGKLAALASGEPAPQASPAASAGASRSQAVVVMEFETVGGKRDGPKAWPLTEAYLAELAEMFPGIDAKAECRKALGWTQANPTKRKTFDGMKQFLFGWCKREQNRGGVRATGSAGRAAAGLTSRDAKRAALAAALRSPKS